MAQKPEREIPVGKLIRFLRSEDGPTTVEYAVMLALILGMTMGAIALAGGPVKAFWSNSSDDFSNAVNP